MKFYIASYVGERERTREIHALLRARGHEITMDWTSFPGVPSPERNDRTDEVRAIAVRDLEGIRAADVFVLLSGVADGRAKYAELGAAIMSSLQNGTPRVYVLGDRPVHSVFFFHPTVTRLSSIEEVLRDPCGGTFRDIGLSGETGRDND